MLTNLEIKDSGAKPQRGWDKFAEAARAAHKELPYSFYMVDANHDGKGDIRALVTGGKKDTDPCFLVYVDLQKMQARIECTRASDVDLARRGHSGPHVTALYNELMNGGSLKLPKVPRGSGASPASRNVES